MNPKLKKNLLVISSVLITLVVAASLAPIFLNSSQMKSTLEQLALKQAGYKLTIGGDIDIRLLPTPRVRIENVALASPTSIQTPFAKMKTLDVGVKLFPLLGGRIEVTRLAFHAPDISLKKTSAGNNWSSSLDDSSKLLPKPKEIKKPAPPTQVEATLLPKSFILYDFDINDGKVTYSDQSSGAKVQMEKLDLNAVMSSLDSPLKITGNTLWNGQQVKIKGNINSIQSILQSKDTTLSFNWDSDLVKLAFDGTLRQVRLFGNTHFKSTSATAIYPWLSGIAPNEKQPAFPLEIAGAVDCTLQQCALSDIAMTANGDKMDIKGGVALNLVDSPLHITADLKMDKLDITPYLGKKTAANFSLISNAVAQTAARWSNDPIDLSMLKQFQGNISISFNEFIAGAFKTGKGIFRIKNIQPIFSAEAVNTELYGGKANVFVNLGYNNRIDGRLMATSVQLEPLLGALSTDNRFSGSATTQFAFTSILNSEASLVGNLNGSGNFSVKDGSVKGLDIASMIRNLQSAYKEVDTSSKKTDFAEASGKFVMANGIIQNNDLAMKAPLFRVSGKGSINLPAYTINYLLTPQIVETIQGQGGKEKEGLGVPILISGSLSNPTYAPDVKGVIEDAIKNPQGVKDTVNKVKGLFRNPKAVGVEPGAAPPAGTKQKPMNQLKDLLKGI